MWLGVPPTLTASSDVLMLRDAYGLRFGLLAQVTGPSGQPRTYLFDVDLCHGFQQVLDSGYHPDTATATAAWRGLVGSSAASAEPEPATDDLLAQVLPGAGLIDGLFAQPLSDSHFTELYRGDRIVGAITDALGSRRPPGRLAGPRPAAGQRPGRVPVRAVQGLGRPQPRSSCRPRPARTRTSSPGCCTTG